MKVSLRRTLVRRGAMAMVIFGLVLVYIPFYWIFRTSILPFELIFKTPLKYIPTVVTFKYYKYIFYELPFLRWFLNSFIVASATAFISISIAAPAAYTFARFKFLGRSFFLITILLLNAIPQIAVIVPYYLLFHALGLLDTYAALIISYLAFALPFSIWILFGYFNTLPRTLEEAALVDGCNETQALLKVTLPLAIPGLIAATIYAFLTAWNEFLLALTFTNKETMRTLPVGLASFAGVHRAEWGPLMAGCVISIIPVIIVFRFVEKNIVTGLTQGGVKE